MFGWLYPQTIETVASKFNGQIKVTKFRGQYSIWTSGFEQSGPIYVEKVWKKGLEKINFLPKNILILGLGCGTVVKLISQKWPRARISGVEIDPVMIKLGKKYFGLDNFSQLKIILGDAKKQKLSGYDLIICDAYLGAKDQLSKLKSKIVVMSNILNPKTLKNEVKVFRPDLS